MKCVKSVCQSRPEHRLIAVATGHLPRSGWTPCRICPAGRAGNQSRPTWAWCRAAVDRHAHWPPSPAAASGTRCARRTISASDCESGSGLPRRGASNHHAHQQHLAQQFGVIIFPDPAWAILREVKGQNTDKEWLMPPQRKGDNSGRSCLCRFAAMFWRWSSGDFRRLHGSNNSSPYKLRRVRVRAIGGRREDFCSMHRQDHAYVPGGLRDGGGGR